MGTKIVTRSLKKDFCDSIALRSAINAATQTRSKKYHVYVDSLTKKKKQEVILFWKNKLKKFIKPYMKNRKNDTDFVTDVNRLKKSINRKYKDCFYGENGIRIAQCQKSLSVYLKWLWCLGIAKFEPPVCPIDRNVLNQCFVNLDRKNDKENKDFLKKINKAGGWGQIDCLKDYKKLLDIASAISNKANLSIAVWELSFFNNIIENEEHD